MTVPPIRVSELDLQRLESLLAAMAHLPAELELLQAELERAEILPAQQMPAQVVTMNSRVRFRLASSQKEFDKVLCYPKDESLSPDHLSVFAPMGSALLGLAAGQSIVWPLPNGQQTEVCILEVLYQPEAAGDWHR